MCSTLCNTRVLQWKEGRRHSNISDLIVVFLFVFIFFILLEAIDSSLHNLPQSIFLDLKTVLTSIYCSANRNASLRKDPEYSLPRGGRCLWPRTRTSCLFRTLALASLAFSHQLLHWVGDACALNYFIIFEYLLQYQSSAMAHSTSQVQLY